MNLALDQVAIGRAAWLREREQKSWDDWRAVGAR
jgi:hypothetical protein